MIKAASLFCATLVALCSAKVQANDSALLIDYLHGMDMDQMDANLAQSAAIRPGRIPPLDLTKAQIRFKKTLKLAKTDPERRALILHWAQMQTCADLQQKEMNAESGDRLEYMEWRSRLDQCTTELSKRAADVKTSALAVPASPKKAVPKKKT